MTTDSQHRHAVAPNLLARQFDVALPEQVWAGDITYLWTAEGWLYLAVLLDWYARKVVGGAMSAHIDAPLVQEALRMALGRRQPSPGLLHHSDRGSQDACQAYQGLLAHAGVRCSRSRKGECLDNAVAERFFGSLKGNGRPMVSMRPGKTRGLTSLITSKCFTTVRGSTRISGIAAPMNTRHCKRSLNSVSVFT